MRDSMAVVNKPGMGAAAAQVALQERESEAGIMMMSFGQLHACMGPSVHSMSQVQPC